MFIQESTSTALRRLGSALDAIGVKPSSDDFTKFCERNGRENQVVHGLCEFWKARVPVTSVSGFIGLVFPEHVEDRLHIFRRIWTKATIEDLESFEARKLASFLRPVEPFSPSGAVGRRVLLSIFEAGDSPEGPVDKGNPRAMLVVKADPSSQMRMGRQIC